MNEDIQMSESPSDRPSIGMVGCGNIGGRQAKNFLDHGYEVYVYDISKERMLQMQALGARITDSCAELAAHAEIIFTSLPTPADAIVAVLEGEDNLCQGLRSRSVYIDMTTNSPETVIRLHQAMEKLGVEMLDAPFNDSPAGAYSKSGMGLAVLASGSRSTFERVRPVLELMADRVLYCGEIGSGTRCKLIHNAVNAVAVQAVSEGITLGLAQGLPLSTIWEALRFGSFGQNAGDIHGLDYYWFSRRFEDLSQPPAFTVKLLRKDLQLALDIARQSGVSVEHIRLTLQDYEEAEQRGWSDYSTSKVRCLQEERSGAIAKANDTILSDLDPSPAQPNSPIQEPSVSQKYRFSLAWVCLFVLFTNLLQCLVVAMLHSH